MSSLSSYKALKSAFIAVGMATSISGVCATASKSTDAASDASLRVLLTEQPPLPGTGPSLDHNPRTQVQLKPRGTTVKMTGDTIYHAFGQPVIAREIECRHTCDSALWTMRNNPTAFRALGTRYPLAPNAGTVAGVDPNHAELHGRGGWNLALVELQANAMPWPWETRVAKTTSEPNAKLEAKP